MSPLPKIHLSWEQARALLGDLSRSELTLPVLNWGDVRVTAKSALWDQRQNIVTLQGDVVLTRGDERVSADTLTLETDGATFTANNPAVLSPPFFVGGTVIARGVDGALQIEQARVVPCGDGKGEVVFTARRAVLSADRRTVVLERPTLSLFGLRLLSLRRITLHPGRERDRESLPLPLRFRYSGVTGPVLGVGAPFLFAGDVAGKAFVDFPARGPAQLSLTLTRDLLPPAVGPSPLERIPQTLRAFLTARPPLPAFDPVLDYAEISAEPSSVSNPTRETSRRLQAEFIAWNDQEITFKRQGPLLLSRLPLLRLSGRFPLGAPLRSRGETNLARRASLKQVRPVLIGRVEAGRFAENLLFGDRTRSAHTRGAATLGIGTEPLLIGENLLLRAQATWTGFTYSGGHESQIWENDLTTAWVFGARTAIGASYLYRRQSGAAPFVYDRIDTPSEARLRGQIPVGRVVVGALLRYDLDESRVFDWEIAVARPLKCLEPRISYRKLNSQINVGITLPASLTNF